MKILPTWPDIESPEFVKRLSRIRKCIDLDTDAGWSDLQLLNYLQNLGERHRHFAEEVAAASIALKVLEGSYVPTYSTSLEEGS